MKSLRSIIRESIQLAENVQQADKIYFNTGLLSPEVKRYILQITGGDAYTKLITDIYYAEQQQQHRVGKWALAQVSDDEEPEMTGHIASENDVMSLEDWKRVKAMYLQLKSYNRNVFPIKGLHINGVADIWDLIRALKERESILERIKKLPSIAIRNMKNDIRQERNSSELQDYRSGLEDFLAHYSYLGNRNPRLRKGIENKMFKADVTLDDLLSFVEDKENLLGGAKFTKNSIKKLVKENDYDMNIVYDSGNIMIVDVTSPEAIKQIGCNSLWCFTYGKGFEAAYRDWNNYSTNDHVYIIVDFSEQSDSPEFMHVLIKPLYFQSNVEQDEENDNKLFNMANEDVAGALYRIEHMMNLDKAYQILNFGEDRVGQNSKWPHEDPNQTKLDLKEIRKLIRKFLQ